MSVAIDIAESLLLIHIDEVTKCGCNKQQMPTDCICRICQLSSAPYFCYKQHASSQSASTGGPRFLTITPHLL